MPRLAGFFAGFVLAAGFADIDDLDAGFFFIADIEGISQEGTGTIAG